MRARMSPRVVGILVLFFCILGLVGLERAQAQKKLVVCGKTSCCNFNTWRMIEGKTGTYMAFKAPAMITYAPYTTSGTMVTPLQCCCVGTEECTMQTNLNRLELEVTVDIGTSTRKCAYVTPSSCLPSPPLVPLSQQYPQTINFTMVTGTFTIDRYICFNPEG